MVSVYGDSEHDIIKHSANPAYTSPPFYREKSFHAPLMEKTYTIKKEMIRKAITGSRSTILIMHKKS
jgi:hypothetical protein